jgi:hypothetical protein
LTTVDKIFKSFKQIKGFILGIKKGGVAHALLTQSKPNYHPPKQSGYLDFSQPIDWLKFILNGVKELPLF